MSGAQAVQFPVFATGNPGGFSVTGDSAGGNLLTSGLIKKAATINGQWVGTAVSADVLTAKPDASPATGSFSTTIQPAVLHQRRPSRLGPRPGRGGLKSLSSSSSRTAPARWPWTPLSAGDNNSRDDLRVRVVKDMGVALTLTNTLSVTTAGASAWVDIRGEDTIASYPGGAQRHPDRWRPDRRRARRRGVGRGGDRPDIIIELPGGGTAPRARFAIAGDPDKDNSSVGAAGTPINLSPGKSHERVISLRDANGTPVPLTTAQIATVIEVTETKADKKDLWLEVAKSDAEGDYTLTITANKLEKDDTTDDQNNVTVVGRDGRRHA